MLNNQDRSYLKRIGKSVSLEGDLGFTPSYDPIRKEFYFKGKQSNLIWAFVRRNLNYQAEYFKASLSKNNREEVLQLLSSNYDMSYAVDPTEEVYKGRFYISTEFIAADSSSKEINPFYVNLICKELEFNIRRNQRFSLHAKYVSDSLPYLNSHTLAPLSYSNLVYVLIAFYLYPKLTRAGSPEAKLFTEEARLILPTHKQIQPKSLNLYLTIAREIVQHGPLFFFRVASEAKGNKTRRAKLKK